MSSTAVVRLDSIDRIFPASPPVEAVRGVDLAIDEGEYVSVVGPSGSGKSTLLNILGCLDKPTRGSYRLRDYDVASLSDGARAGLRGREIGFVFQGFHMLPHRSALENVMTGLLYNRTPRKARRGQAAEALERVGLSHRMGFAPSLLSGGERQRVAIARAVAASPSLLLCDEPTGNLDSTTTESILDLFDALHQQGLTLVVVTHDETVSSRSDRRVEMVDGVLTEAGQ